MAGLRHESEESGMNTRRVLGVVVLAIGVTSAGETPVRGQCCLTDLFAGCGSCFRKPAYAVAPVVAPVAAPIAAPVVAAPMMVPMQQPRPQPLPRAPRRRR